MAEIDRLVVVWDARFDQMDQKLNKVIRSNYAAADKVTKKWKQANDNIKGGALTGALEGLASRGPAAAGGLTQLGTAGLTAGAALGVLTIAANRAIEAMNFGDELQTTANKLQVTAEAFQELSFAADETDVPIDKLQSGLEKLNGQIGALKTGIGGKKVEGAFAALGITKESLRDVNNANDLLPILADRLGQIGDTATQVQLARKLGVEELLPLLRRGSAGLAEMRDRSHELGLVLSNETVQGLADADRQMELAAQQINTNLRGAFAGLATDIAKMTGALASVIVFFRQLEQKAPQVAGALKQLGEIAVASAIPGGNLARLALRALPGPQSSAFPTRSEMLALSQPPTKAGGFVPVTTPTGGGAKTATAKGLQLDATPDKVRDLAATREQLTLELQLAVARERNNDQLSQALADRLTKLKLVQEFEDAGFTAAEARRKAEAQITDLVQARAAASKDDALATELAANLAAQQAAIEAAGESIAAANEGINRSFNDVANDGLQNLVDGLAGVAAGYESLGDVAKRVLQQMTYDLTKMNLEKALGIGEGGSSGSGAGGFLKSLFKLGAGSISGGGGFGSFGPLPADLQGLLADGTDSVPRSGRYLVGERGPEIVNLQRGAQVIPNGILRGLAARGGSSSSTSTFAPTMHVTVMGGGGSGADNRRTGNQIAAAAMERMAQSRKRGF